MPIRVILLSLALAACATTPALDKRAAAEEVFRLSGGLNDLRLMAQFAPAMLDTGDLKQRCLDSLGRNPNPIARAACDMLDNLGQAPGGLAERLDRQIARLEAHAVDAMVETYSAEELAAMRRYYASPEGRSIVAKRGEYLRRLASGG